MNCAFTKHYEKGVINGGTLWSGVNAYGIFEYTVYSGVMAQHEFDERNLRLDPKNRKIIQILGKRIFELCGHPDLRDVPGIEFEECEIDDLDHLKIDLSEFKNLSFEEVNVEYRVSLEQVLENREYSQSSILGINLIGHNRRSKDKDYYPDFYLIFSKRGNSNKKGFVNLGTKDINLQIKNRTVRQIFLPIPVAFDIVTLPIQTGMWILYYFPGIFFVRGPLGLPPWYPKE